MCQRRTTSMKRRCLAFLLANTESNLHSPDGLLAVEVFFEVAQQSDLIATSPARPKIHRPIAHRTEKPSLSAGDAWKVLANIEPCFRLIVVTDALTGYRAGELFAFRWLNFDPEAGTLQATHGLFNGRLVEGVKTARSSKPLKLARVHTLMLEEHRASSEWKEPEHFI
jgi:integrase